MSDDKKALIEEIANTPEFRVAFGSAIGRQVGEQAKPIWVSDIGQDESLPDLTPEHFRAVCRAGQGPLTCRFAAMALTGIMCAKSLPGLRDDINARAATLKSKGDNCPGRKGYIPSATRF